MSKNQADSTIRPRSLSTPRKSSRECSSRNGHGRLRIRIAGRSLHSDRQRPIVNALGQRIASTHRQSTVFFTDEHPGSIPIHLVYEDGFEAWSAALDERTRNWLGANGFKGERFKVVLVPSSEGLPLAVFAGLGRRTAREDFSCWNSTGLPDRLADGRYHLAQPLAPSSAMQFAFGWAYGQYRFERYRRASVPRELQLQAQAGVDVAEIERLRAATALARDLVNTPANDMTPAALASAAVELARRYGCRHREIIGDALITEGFPAVHAVGRASAVAPRLVDME